HIIDTCVETCTKTCAEYCPITVEHPHTEYVPSAISVTETELQTVTMCQPITVSVPVTEYDTICQIVTVEHTATLTKPVLVVQNVCTDVPSAAASAQHAYAADAAAAGADPYDQSGRANGDDEMDDLDLIAKKAPKKSAKKVVAAKKAAKVM
ncbi:hypothetical protein GGI09_008003, partial [Coemansia sp. S100]